MLQRKDSADIGRKTIACAVIVGDGIDEDNWDKLLDSVEPYVDHMFVNYNGKKDGFPYATPEKCGFTWKHFDWEDNFATARNQSFAMIREHDVEFDWWMWIDSDDVLVDGDKLQEMIASLEPETDAVFLTYNYGVDPITGNVLVHQQRERLLKSTADWNWVYPVHEVAHAAPGTQLTYRDNVRIKHNRKDRSEESTRGRNRRILSKALQQEPNNPRYKYYMANEIFYEAFMSMQNGRPEADEQWQSAAKLYDEFIHSIEFDDNVYIANHRIAEIARYTHNMNLALDAEFQNVKMNPRWPESWIGIAQTWLEAGQWELAEYFADMLLEYVIPKIGFRDTQQVIEPQSENYTPYVIRGIARENLGKLKDAEKDYRTAYKNSDNKEVLTYIDRVKSRMKNGMGAETLKDTRKRLYSSKKNKSIAFVVPPTIEPWHPKYIDKFGSGGAEHCVTEIATRFAKDGWRTVIFGLPGEHEGVDPDTGIEWWNVHDFGAGERFEVIVGSRYPIIFDADLNCDCSLLWLHDVNFMNADMGPLGSRMERASGVICLTDWHKEYTSKMYRTNGKQIEVIPNGVDPSRFDGVDLDRPINSKMVYASSPDRGVQTLLDYWPDIRKINPDAELDVFYGWSAIDKLIAAGNTNLKMFKNRIERQLDGLGREDGGVHWHNRVPRDVLAQKLQESSFWAYPTQFMETYCISALEMQLAGVIPITSDLAALPETVAAKKLLVSGWPNNEQYKKDWLATYESLLNAPIDEIKEIRRIGREHAAQRTWDAAYAEWRRVIADRTRSDDS